MAFKKLFPYFKLLKLVKWQFIGALLCGLIFGVSSGFGLPFMTHKVFPLIFGDNLPSDKMLFLAVAYLPAVFFIRNVSGFFNAYLIGYCSVTVLEAIRMKVFTKLQSLSLEFFENHKSGDLLSRTMSDTNQIQSAVVGVSNDLIKQPVTFLGALGSLIYLSFQNSQILFIFFSLMIIPISIFPIRFIGRKLYMKALSMQKEMGSITDLVSENLNAVREVRVFSLETVQIKSFLKTIRGLFKIQLKVIKYAKSLSPSIEFVSSIGVAIAIVYAAKIRIPLEEVIPLIFALYLSYDPIKNFGVINNEFKKGLASLTRIEEIINTPDTITDQPLAQNFEVVTGHIAFKKVDFSYKEGGVLQNVSCQLNPGKVHALVGPSGAGKSTFANLILRLYDVKKGSITLDGKDIREIKLDSLRRNIALVPQDPVLFNDTIFNNILLSYPNAKKKAVYEAARKAYAHPFIESFEQGYETIVGNRGTRLSGGQKQRIALARAFLKNAPILILDEATSSLDSESENKIQEALEILVQGKTVIIIAHRFSTIQMADRILVFDQGRLIGNDSHNILLETNDLYAKLYSRRY